MSTLSSFFRIIAAVAIVTGSCVLATSLSGCGKRPAAGAAPTTEEEDPASRLRPTIEQVRDNSAVSCGDAKACPENVGMLAIANENGFARCTASLIAPDTVLTAASCIPAALRSPDAACGDRIRFLLPATMAGQGAAVPAVQARCAQVTEVGQDHALIRLETPIAGRAPLKTDSSGVVDNAWLRVVSIHSLSDTQPIGEIAVSHCRAIQRSLVAPGFRAAASRQVAFAECPTEESSAGAPVLSGLGAIRAVVTEGVSPGEIGAIRARYPGMMDGTPADDLARGANVACIPLSDTRALPAACATSAVAAKISPFELSPEQLDYARARVAKIVAQWQSRGGEGFGWKPTGITRSINQEVQAIPNCLASDMSWIKHYEHWIRATDEYAFKSFEVPRIGIRFRLNSAFQLEYFIDEMPKVALRLIFSPRQIQKTRQTEASWISRTPGAKVTLRACTQGQ